MKYIIYGNIYSATSFSNVILHMAYYLRKSGNEVVLKSTELLNEPEETLIAKYMSHMPDSNDLLKNCLYKDQNDFDVAIYFLVDPLVHAPNKSIRAKKHIFYTVWSHNNYPIKWAEALNQYDEVWTPSHANSDAIVKTGKCNKPIIVMPHGYEPLVFNNLDRHKNKTFKIGMCNSICNFKGADVALEAFMESFDYGDDVELWLQSTVSVRNNHGDKHGQYYKEYIDILNKYPDKQLKTFYYQKDCNISEMADFYRSCDLILSPHRGDGFGLVGLEAMACGVPVVISNYHGPKDYISEAYPYWLCGSMDWVNHFSNKPHWPDGGDKEEIYMFFNPDKEHLKKILLSAYSDWQHDITLECKQYFKGQSWQSIVDFVERLCNGKSI